MLFRASFIVLAAVLFESVLANGNRVCGGGTYLDLKNNGTWDCKPCADGHFKKGSNALTRCNKCPAGQTNNARKTGCDDCHGETYSLGGTACMTCPAGSERNEDGTGCTKCCKGEYNPTPGGRCARCPVGTFSDIKGATSCCKCCAGWYSASPGSEQCDECPNNKKFGPVGSSSRDNCKKNADKPNGIDHASNCYIDGTTCPPTTPGGPQGSQIARKRSPAACAVGLTSCPRFSGAGGSDCIDTENDPESCGGCVGANGEGPGTDCTAADGVNVTRCVKGSCVVDSCRKGWVKSLGGSSCVPADTLYEQEADKKKRDTVKRAIRHTMF